MPFYLFQCSYTPEALKAMIDQPQDRAAAAGKMIAALGGKLHHFFFSFGQDDVVCLIEGPDDKMMMAGAMLVASSGSIRSAHSTKLFTPAEAIGAMDAARKAASSYTPPRG